MDFFAQQDQARRTSRQLVLLFLAAVLLLITLTTVFIAVFLFVTQDWNIYSGSRTGVQGFYSYFTGARFGGIGLAITATVALVVLVKWIQLSAGGKTVAESMGAERILPQTRDAPERRCLNVVEELSLAANMPVPAVYVLNDERGINAFAAGITPADAVVAVTRGAIEQLQRHELQGVIAHEFSHILNGDIRLNIRLAACLKGITFVGDCGRFLLDSSNRVRTGHRDRQGAVIGALPVLGMALWVLGWLGWLAAGFIKAAISRQKEYLADASAVQFTRSTDGIGDALKVIGGYIPGTLVHAARALEMSHIFFGQIEHILWQVFPTHPPLRERIRRVDPHWDGQYIQRRPVQYQPSSALGESAAAGVGRAALVAAAMAAAALDPADQPVVNAAPGQHPEPAAPAIAAHEAIPLSLLQHSREPLGAQSLIHALLVSAEPATRQRQLDILSRAGTPGLETLVNTLYPAVHALGAPHRLPLVQLCLPALKAVSPAQYRQFRDLLVQLIRADGQTTLHEWCLYQLVRHYLDPEFVAVKPSRARYRKLTQVQAPVGTVLSTLAHAGSSEPQTAFGRGADALELLDVALLPLEQCSVATFSRAVHTLADCYPLLKPRLLKAMVLCAASDGEPNAVEQEILASVAAVMDCPVTFPLPA